MINLELIADKLNKDKALLSQLQENKVPHHVITHMEGKMEVYEGIIKGDYNIK